MKVTSLLFLAMNLLFVSTTDAYIPLLTFKDATKQSSGAAAAATHHVLLANESNNNNLECDACQFIAHGLNKTVFNNPKLLNFTVTELDDFCQVLPSGVQKACEAEVTTFAPELLQKIGEYIADNGCIELGICHDAEKVIAHNILGGHLHSK